MYVNAQYLCRARSIENVELVWSFLCFVLGPGSWAGRQAGRQVYIPALYQVRRTVVNDVGGSSYKYISILLGQYVSGMVVGLSSFELFTWCVCVCWSLFTSLFHLLSSTLLLLVV